MDNDRQPWNEWRDKIIGLGEQSSRKNYYPELQKRVEELRASEADLWTLFNTVTDAIFIHDHQGRVIDVNDAMLALYRVTREQALQFTIGDYSAPGYSQELLPKVWPEFERNQRLLFEWKAQRPLDKTLFDAEVSLRPSRWKNKPVIVAVVRDITERKKAEAVLEQRLLALTRPLDDTAGITFEELFNLKDIQRLQDEFANATGVASIITRVDGTPLTTPSNFCRLCLDIIRKTGKGLANCVKNGAVLGRLSTEGPTIQACLSGGFWDAGAGISVGGRHIANWLIGQVRDETQTEEKMRVYAREIGADEETVVQAFREVPIMSRQRFQHVAQVLFTLANQLSTFAYQNVQQARSITELRRAEVERHKLQEQLLQLQKIDAVGRLAGGVAHDFNNMLQAILGNTALALEDLPPQSSLRECLEEIQKSAQRSVELTRQLLAFARKQTISPRVLDLNDTITGMLKMLRRLIGEHIDLIWIPGADLWPVKLDPSQVDQILANLSVNARDAIVGIGKVTIQTTNVILDQTYAQSHPDCVPGDYVVLSVTDTGHGMDAETRAHLFEPFFTTKEPGKGTGLGLATVFGIVKQNQGLISVYSEPGRGTTFKIYLRRAELETAAPQPKASGQTRKGTETVLLVEDEQQILDLGRRILQQHGYRVLVAPTPEAALALTSQDDRPIHLLITDVVMPGLNGKELQEQLRARYPGLKCLFMSGYTADVIAHHGVLEKGVQFLQKPFTIQSLTEKVREVLDLE